MSESGDQTRRPDASMDLLNNILRQPLDPDYTEERHADPRQRSPWGKSVLFVVVGALLAVGAAQTARGAPAAQAERAQLITLIQQQGNSLDAARQRLEGLEREIRSLRESRLGTGAQAQEIQREIESLEVAAGARPVVGPGIMIVLDDGPEADKLGRIIDLDLRQAANGLWLAGAEAVAINGHRLSSRTAIRGAGDAITVDYRSLTRPYRIEAIGDPQDLQSRFQLSGGGSWLGYLRDTHKIVYQITIVQRIRMAADPGLTVTRATPPQR